MVESDRPRRKHINRRRAEELYRQTEADDRIQKILAHRNCGYNGQKHSVATTNSEPNQNRTCKENTEEGERPIQTAYLKEDAEENITPPEKDKINYMRIPPTPTRKYGREDIKEAKKTGVRCWDIYKDIEHEDQTTLDAMRRTGEKEDGGIKA